MILDRFRLDDRVAIVTGAGMGIGQAISVALAEAGARIACCARTQADIDQTVKEVEATGSEGLAFRCDVTESADLDALVAATIDRFGRIDILVNNAGGMQPVPAFELSEDDFERVLRFNLTSTFLLTQKVVPHMMRTAGGGSIVNISSGASVQSIQGLAPYASAKAGLNQLTRVLGIEYAPQIRLNSIIVGHVLTAAARAATPEDALRASAENVPLKRLGLPEDIAACALYLASPAADWVTGQSFTVNGGADNVPHQFPVPRLAERFPESSRTRIRE